MENVLNFISNMFQDLTETVLISAPISEKIEHSFSLGKREKERFTALLSYFTDEELAELRTLI